MTMETTLFTAALGLTPPWEVLAGARSRDEAERLLNEWCSWARRCRLQPFKKLAWTLREHWQGLLNGFDSRLSNGSVEGMNAMIQAAKARARGYQTTRNLATMAYLIGGKLSRLPASPKLREKPPALAVGRVSIAQNADFDTENAALKTKTEELKSDQGEAAKTPPHG